jgi:hypothetical protein
MPVHAHVLEAALRICVARRGWTFRPVEIVSALPALNAASVRTHIMSRCCVNAPPHHAHRWPYFRRVRRGIYEILPALRRRRPEGRRGVARTPGDPSGPGRRGADEPPMSIDIRESGGRYVATSTALPRNVEGSSVESVVSGILRLAAGRAGMRGEALRRPSITMHLRGRPALAPPDPFIAAYASDVDRTLIRENLRLSVEGRIRKLQHWMEAMQAIRGVARRSGRREGEP